MCGRGGGGEFKIERYNRFSIYGRDLTAFDDTEGIEIWESVFLTKLS